MTLIVEDLMMQEKRVRPITFMVIALVALGVAGIVYQHNAGSAELYVIREFLMDTVVEIQVPKRHQTAARQAVVRLRELARIFDPETGEIAQINATLEPVPVSQEVYDLFEQVLTYASLVEGSFDVGLGALVELWDFTGSNPQVPDMEALEAARAAWQPMAFRLDPEKRTVQRTHAGVKLELGGVAKGFIVDETVASLRAQGVDSGLVNAGGDLFTIGGRPTGGPWRIAVRHPRNASGVLGVLRVEDGAVATSGDYQRYFIQDGQRYHHILDPQTGWPADQCISVTVITGSVTLADLLATAAFVLGPEAGMALIEGVPATEGIIVDWQGRVHLSGGLDPAQWPPRIEVTE